MAMDAILAIIADDGQAIIVHDREAVEINYFLLYFIDSAKTLDGGLIQPLAKRLPGARYFCPSKPCRCRGKQLHHGGFVCVLVFS
jgi:hypothetical protein